jgi:hypothetical protein
MLFNNFITFLLQNKIIKDEDAFNIYGQFLKTLKSFKRTNENALKFTERDVDAFMRKYETIGIQLLPIIHDIKMNVLDRMGKFGKDIYNQFIFHM